MFENDYPYRTISICLKVKHISFFSFFRIATMSAQMVNNLLNVEVNNSSKIPVEHLDYNYIEKCTDLGYLENILKVLR